MSAAPAGNRSLVSTLMPGAGLPAGVLDLLKAASTRKAVGEDLLGTDVPGMPLLSAMAQTGGAVGKGHGHGTGVVDWNTLRIIRESSCVLIPIHEARQHALARFARKSFGKPGEIGWRVVHRDYANPAQQVPTRLRPLISEAEDVLSTTMPELQCHGVGSLLKSLWDDYATLNRPALECVYRDGKLRALRPIDGARVWESNAFLQRWARGQSAAMEKLRTGADRLAYAQDKIGVDFRRSRYVWVESDVTIKGLTTEQVIVGTERTSTDIQYGPYPPGKVERALNMAVYGDQVMEYSASYFTQGMQSNWIMFLPENSTQEAQQQFATHFARKSQGLQHAHQPVMIGADAKNVHLENLAPGMPKDFAFEGMLAIVVAMICAVYRIDPSTINAKPWDGGSGPKLTEGGREEEIASAKEEGLSGDLEHLRASCLDPAVQRIHPDLMVVIDDGSFDPKAQQELIKARKTGVETTNEIRVGEGMKPLGFYLDADQMDTASKKDKLRHEANPYNHVADSAMGTVTMLTSNAQQQLDAMNQPQQPGAEAGAPGGQDAPEDAPEEDDGGDWGQQKPQGGEDDGWPDVGADE